MIKLEPITEKDHQSCNGCMKETAVAKLNITHGPNTHETRFCKKCLDRLDGEIKRFNYNELS